MKIRIKISKIEQDRYCKEILRLNPKKSRSHKIARHSSKNENFCQTPVLGLGLGVDFTFAWDNKNPHLNSLAVLGDKG